MSIVERFKKMTPESGVEYGPVDYSELADLDPTDFHFNLPIQFWNHLNRLSKKGDDKLLMSLDNYRGPKVPTEWIEIIEADSQNDLESALFLLEISLNEKNNYCADIPQLIENLDKHSDEWTMASAALGLIYRNKRLLESIGLEPSSPEAIEKTIKYFKKIRYESRYGDRLRLVVMDLMISEWQVWEHDSPIEAMFEVELMAYLPAFETAHILESHDNIQDWNFIIRAFNEHYFDDFDDFHHTYEEWIGINCISNFLAFLLSEKIDCVYGVLDPKCWTYDEEIWGGVGRPRPIYHGPKFNPWWARFGSSRLNKVGYNYLRMTLCELSNIDLKFWKQFDKDFTDDFIWTFISLLSGEHLTKDERAKLDYFLFEEEDSRYEKWLKLAVKLNARSEHAKKMLKEIND